jgi:hypothetical protein
MSFVGLWTLLTLIQWMIAHWLKMIFLIKHSITLLKLSTLEVIMHNGDFRQVVLLVVYLLHLPLKLHIPQLQLQVLLVYWPIERVLMTCLLYWPQVVLNIAML